MRNTYLFLATAATTVALAGTAHADTIFDGFGSIEAGYHSLAQRNASFADYSDGTLENAGSIDNPGKYSGLAINARISASVPLGGLFGAQFDGAFNHIVSKVPASFEEPAFKTDESSLAAHAFARSDRGLIGLVGQRTTTSSNYSIGTTNYFIGGEAQAYLGNATLYGQVAFETSDHASGSFFGDIGQGSGPTATLQARYFVNPNWVLTAKGGYQFSARNFAESSSDNFRFTESAWLIGARSEYRLPNSHVSFSVDADFRPMLFKDYENFEGEGSSFDTARVSLHDFRVLVGVKLNFGSKTLIERDRSGASLDPVTPIVDGVANLVSGFGGSGGLD